MSKPLTSIEDLYEDPGAFGMPTFDEFRKNREKWLGRDDDTLACVSKGGEAANKKHSKHTYEIEGYRCKTLEEVERVAREQGIALRSLDFRAIIVPQGAGRGELLIKFVSKDERSRRDGNC